MPHIQTIVVFIIIGCAAGYLIRRFYKSLKRGGSASCNCGCSGCNVSQSCDDSPSRQS